LPWIFKIILALPVFDGIAWGIYRIAKGVSKNDTTLIVVGILWIVLGIFILWVIDLVTILLYKKPTVLV
jgi:E3 ubiquitin-protein ligase DOA10